MKFLWHCSAAQTVRQFVRKQLKGKKNPSPCFPPNTCPSTTQHRPASPTPPPRVTLGFRPSNTGLFLPSESSQILFSLPGRSFSLPSTRGCLQSFQDLGILNLMKPFLMLSVIFFFLHIIKITHFVYSSMGSDQHTLTYLPQSRYRIVLSSPPKLPVPLCSQLFPLPGNHQLVYHPSSFAFSRIS